MHPSSALKRNFNASQFSFEKEDTDAEFSHAALLTKMDRSHRMTNAKGTFVYFKKTRKIMEIRFWPIRTQLCEPLSAVKKQWF